MKRGGFFLFLLLFGLWAMPAKAVWWAYNYIPTADTYYPDTIWPHYSLYGLTDSDLGSFQDTRVNIFSVSLGMPTIKLGKGWELNSDIGIDLYQPDEKTYDDTFWNAKVRFIQEGQFCKATPAVAVGVCYLGGRDDLDYWKHFKRKVEYVPVTRLRIPVRTTKMEYDHPSASNPSVYLVASKWLPIPYFETQVTAGFMWNNFGINEEDIPLVGIFPWLIPKKVGLMLDYYGGDYGNYGAGLWWIVNEKVEVGISYFFPDDYPRQAKAIDSESLWAMVYLNLPLKLFGRK